MIYRCVMSVMSCPSVLLCSLHPSLLSTTRITSFAFLQTKHHHSVHWRIRISASLGRKSVGYILLHGCYCSRQIEKTLEHVVRFRAQAVHQQPMAGCSVGACWAELLAIRLPGGMTYLWYCCRLRRAPPEAACLSAVFAMCAVVGVFPMHLCL